MARELVWTRAKLAVVTCEALGSVAWDGSVAAETGIRPVEVLDTTGADDSFIAGFLAARHLERSLRACLDVGRDVAETCTHVGEFPRSPQPWSR